MGTVLLVVGAAGLAYLSVKVVRGAAELRRRCLVLSRLPHPPHGFFGALDLIKDQDHIYQNFAKLSDELGGILYFRVLWAPMVLVSEPALCQFLLSAKLDLPKEPNIYKTFNMLTSPAGRTPNLLGYPTNDGYWGLVRKGVSPAFSPRNIRGEFHHVTALSEQICTLLEAAGPHALVDVDNLFQRESMDVIGRVGFGTDFGALKRAAGGQGESTAIDPDDAFNAIKGAALEVAKRWAQPLRARLRHVLPDARRGEAALRAYQRHMRALTREIQARGPPAQDDTSIAAHLLRIRDPATGRPLTDEQLAGEVGLFFGAGFETTGHTMAWALFCLAQHPEAAAKVESELDGAGLLLTPARPRPGPLTYDDLSQLRFLSACIKESQRLVPVVAGGQAKVATRDLTLGGYTIPKGTLLIVGGLGLNTSPHNWERPRDFLPERWDEPGAEYWRGDLCPMVHAGGAASAAAQGAAAVKGGRAAAEGEEGEEGEEEGELLSEEEAWTLVDGDRPPLRFAPFQQGPRNCIGQNLAKMNYTATLAILLSRFRFELPPQLQGPGALWDLQANVMTNQPKNGLPMHCIPRSAAA